MSDIILCSIVVEKAGELERFCTEEALFAFPIMDDDNVKPIDGIALCQEHSDKFDDGKPLVAMSKCGHRFLIQLNPDEQESILESVQ
jgi:hypothetical protein